MGRDGDLEGVMSSEMFGNLRDWGEALQNLNELKKAGRLDEHQPGLVRILRYKYNWRLREAVLGCLAQVSHPSLELVNEVCRLASDEETYHEVRILAAHALPCLMRNFDDTQGHEAAQLRDSVARKMEVLLRSPQPPVIHEAVHRSYQAITGDAQGSDERAL